MSVVDQKQKTVSPFFSDGVLRFVDLTEGVLSAHTLRVD